ncbi:PREDICTED: aklanonic acid methyltransferase DauC-like [Acropora digitifera]|uniref:aklanonic acid methyltransferase DauC-like n=1 Tax=Acropora digitifera TaxID=70779 RepID=UPI00077AFBF7|nr:PREDICTED: aklanonic acid methyltransferase DauC-like [Acropora digitifera]
MATFYSQSAAEGYQQASLTHQKALGEEFIESDVCPQSGDAILDLGCGTGELAAFLAGLVGPKGKVVGVDPDKERLQLARLSHGNVKNLSFVEGNASTISEIFPAATFDIIFSNYVLHWIPDKPNAFRNMFTCVKPGGKIALVYISHLPLYASKAFAILNPENEKLLCQMFQCESRSQIEQYCLTHGFQISKSHDAPAAFEFENTTKYLEWLSSGTHGVFDQSLVTEERLKKYSFAHREKDGKFRINVEEEYSCRLIAFKKTL